MFAPETLKITNKDGSTFYYVNDVKSPLTNFEPSIMRRADASRERSQDHGINSTISLKGGMEIHMEGALFDDTSADYITQRNAFVLAVEGDPNVAPVLTTRFDLTLDLEFAGDTEAWFGEAIVSEFTAPITALFPAKTDWALTLFFWDPWLVGRTSGNKRYII